MPRTSALTRRAPKEWMIRGLIALAAAWLGYDAVSQSLAYAIRVGQPERAHALAPDNGRITALAAIQLLRPDATSADYARAEKLARAALRHDATAVDAVAALGLIAQGRGDLATTRRLFTYSDYLSRRDLRTRLGMIEDAVSRTDVPGVLRNYDIALRTSRLAGGILFPVLSSAIVDDPVRDNLVRTLATRPPWGDAFISHVTTLGPDPLATVRLLQSLRRAGIALPPDATAIIVDRLLAQDRAAAAWAYYAGVMPNVDPRRSRDAGFASSPAVPSAFDWRAIEDNGISSSIQRGGRKGSFDFSVASSVAGPMLRQTQLLPPGDYLIEGASAGIDQPDASLPYWSLQCLSGREIGRVVVSRSSEDGGAFTGRLSVPADCPVQHLTLVARSSDAVGGLSGQILRIGIRPASAAQGR